MKKKITLIIGLLSTVLCASAQEQEIEVFLNENMLKNINLNVELNNSIDYTPGNFLLLSSFNQFYALGRNSMFPVLEKTENKIDAFSIATVDSILLIISDKILYQTDSEGKMVKLQDLPADKMGIASDKDGIYLFEQTDIKNKQEYSLFSLSREVVITKLISIQTPVSSVLKYQSILFFTSQNKIYYVVEDGDRYEELFTLSDDNNDKIISLVGDIENQALYFSTTDTVYRIKENQLDYVCTDFGGILRYDGEGLLIFNPGKSLIIRIRNNILYNTIEEKTVNIPEQSEETIVVSSTDTISLASLPNSEPVVAPPVSISAPAVTPEPPVVKPETAPETPIVKPETAPETAVVKPKIATETPVVKPTTTPETPPAKTQPQQPKETEQQPNMMGAIDYVTEVKELVDLFQSKQRGFMATVLEWNRQVEVILSEIDRANSSIAQTEKKLDDTKNSAATGITQQINALKSTLTQQRTQLRYLKQKQTSKGMEIIGQLKRIAKQDASDINRKFGETGKKITTSTTFPALSEKRITITFSEEIEKLPISEYLKATNELRFWYKNIEKSFSEIINKQNQRAQNSIDKDGKLSIQLQNLWKQLSEYQQDPKIRKKEIKDLKKEISTLEKERKNVSKQMKKEAGDFAAYLKAYNKEIQTEYKARIQNVTEEIDYSFQQNF
ncbi:MAG: hypothetical protein LBI60_03460 [Bacteroidales bacterium]|jgi:predicted  nucleic acid-binding Zn-ribbon protein|nr:hypothetical protein [Bacteroidales bacterium]